MKAYRDFLAISNTQMYDVNTIYKVINNNQHTHNEEYIYEILTNTDLDLLIKLSLRDSDIDSLCKLPILNSYWKNIWRQCGQNSCENAELNQLPIHENECQTTIHTFDLLKGISLYAEYLNILNINRDDTVNANVFLAAAAKLNFYPALATASKQLAELSIKKNDITIAHEAITLACKAAKSYWSAGYLLLGVLYLKLANLNPDFYLQGLEALLVAKKLEPHSAAMLNNAFQGKSLAEATYGKVKNWDDIPFYFIQKLAINLDSSQINNLYTNANLLTDSILSQHKVEYYDEKQPTLTKKQTR